MLTRWDAQAYRVGDLLTPKAFLEKLKTNLVHVNFLLKNLYKAPTFQCRKSLQGIHGICKGARKAYC